MCHVELEHEELRGGVVGGESGEGGGVAEGGDDAVAVGEGADEGADEGDEEDDAGGMTLGACSLVDSDTLSEMPIAPMDMDDEGDVISEGEE